MTRLWTVTFENYKLDEKCAAYNMDPSKLTAREMVRWLIQLYESNWIDLVSVGVKDV